MTFYDIKPSALPANAEYFHNVLVITIGVNPQIWEFQGDQIWDLDQLTSPTPTAYCLYLEPNLASENEDEADADFEVCIEPHAVVEVCGNEISFYNGTDDNENFSMKEAWRIKHDKVRESRNGS